MKTKIYTFGFMLICLGILFYSITFVLNEGKQAVVTQFGRPIRFVDEPGINFRVPVIQSVTFLDKKLLPWDGAPENMQTRDKKRIFVDCWARWRISGLETFYTNVRSEQKGQKILDDIVDSAVRDVIARNNLIDLVRTTNEKLVYETEELERTATARDTVSTGREQIEAEILRVASEDLSDRYGIELTAVHIKRVKYNDRVRDTVYDRMRSERQRVAQLFQSEAQEDGNRIQGLTQKELDEIEGEMAQRSEEIRGRADAEVIKMTAEAYGEDPEFFEFMQRLEMYKMALQSDTSLVLSTNSDLFRLFKTTDRRSDADVDVALSKEEAGDAPADAATTAAQEDVPDDVEAVATEAAE